MAYTYEQIFAVDEANPQNIARNSTVTIFAPGDAAKTPLTITTPDGLPLANPVIVNGNGYGSAFMHATLDRVAWEGAGFTGFFTSYDGMKNEAVAARQAAEAAAANAAAEAAAAIGTATDAATTAASEAEAAATAAASSAALVGAPADTAMAAAASNSNSQFRGALNATYLDKASAATTYATKAELPAAASQGAVEFATFGDSITESGQGGGIRWPQLVSDYLGLSLYNPSISGEAPPDIAVRQGGLAPQVTVAGNTIPASGAVSVTAISPSSGWRNLVDPPRIGRFQGRLAGIAGELRNNNGTWTFTRTEAGTATPCPANSRFRVDGSKAARSAIQILWAGRNYPDNTVVLRDTATMVEYIEEPKRFLVLSILNTATETIGGTAHTALVAINNNLATTYPNNYLDIRRHMIDHGLQEEGITPTAQDNIDIANDCVPSSLRDDPTHPNAAGIRVIARKVALTLIEKGWVDTAPVFIPAPAIDPNAPTTLSIPASPSKAEYASTTAMQAATTISVEAVFTPTATVPTGPVNIVGKQTSAGGRAWTLYVFADGNMRFQEFNQSQVSDYRESTGGTPFVVGQKIGVRADYTPATGVKFYRSTDGGTTWTLFNTSTAMNGSIYTGSTAPVKVGDSFAMEVDHVGIFSADRATTYLNESFTDNNATGWTLTGASLVSKAAPWPWS